MPHPTTQKRIGVDMARDPLLRLSDPLDGRRPDPFGLGRPVPSIPLWYRLARELQTFLHRRVVRGRGMEANGI